MTSLSVISSAANLSADGKPGNMFCIFFPGLWYVTQLPFFVALLPAVSCSFTQRRVPRASRDPRLPHPRLHLAVCHPDPSRRGRKAGRALQDPCNVRPA